jgi:alpha-galactosidase
VKPDVISTFAVADLTLRYLLDRATGRVGLELFPAALRDRVQPRRPGLAGLPYIDAMPGAGNPPAWVLEPLVQLKLAGDACASGFGNGHTMRNAASVDAFRHDSQRVEKSGAKTTVVTTLKSAAGHSLEHRLAWHTGDAAVEITTTFCNDAATPVQLEMLSSFSFGGITPFASDDAPGRLRAHRFRSVWSAEGRLETRSLEELHLERSWSGAGAFSERFGQVGSMPVRKWFPFGAVEDTQAGVVWGAQLAWAGSWQMEIFRQHDDVCLSGGLADREFGHWLKTIAPGESFTTPPAVLSCVAGSLDELCDRLTAVQQRAADAQPVVEQDLPVVFNEWCTTWGDPQHDKVLDIARRLEGSGVKYLVIDAGWYKTEGVQWWNGQGDWIPNAGLFPNGLEATAAAIRERGLIPGLWFELEVAGKGAAAFSLVDHLLQRDGKPITVGDRRFWNLSDPWVVDYLAKKVIDLLESSGFGYLKVDYNDSIGIGCDHPDSLGEGLRRQTEGTHRFFEKIRQRLPNLVIENCSSGGHRLEPSMLARTAMSSFSDAHELVEIPLIAANLHRLMLPRQSQIWAVLHQADSDQRLVYSLAATFLGRMCLSGEIARLSRDQWELAQRAIRLYREAAPVIKRGTSRRFGELGASWRHPRGWQAVVRQSDDRRQVLIVVHAFAGAPEEISIPLPDSSAWKLAGDFSLSQPVAAGPWSGVLRLKTGGDFAGQVLLFDRVT